MDLMGKQWIITSGAQRHQEGCIGEKGLDRGYGKEEVTWSIIGKRPIAARSSDFLGETKVPIFAQTVTVVRC
jgi:hypothetical protein